MVIVLYVLVVIGLLLNYNTPSLITNIPFGIVFIEGIATTLFGYTIIHKTCKNIPHPIKYRFFNTFLLSFFIGLVYMSQIWVPYMIKNYAIEAFDPVRYYFGINELTRYGEMTAYMNYFGVVYFYSFFMKLLGLHPLIALYINVLLVLFASLTITNYYLSQNNIGKTAKLFPLILLIPEVLCFNAMTSREIICISCFTIFVVKSQQILEKAEFGRIIIATVALLFLFMVRPPFGLVAILCVATFAVLQSKNKKKFWGLLLVIIVVAYFAIQLTLSFGDSFEALTEQLNTSRLVADDSSNTSTSSLSRLLLPSNNVEFFIFGFIRSFAYIILSPSEITNPIASFFYSQSPTQIFASWTSLFMMLCIPKLFKGIKYYRKGECRGFKFLFFSLVMTFFVIGTFMASFIHIRYRIVYDLLYFATAIYLTGIYKNNKKHKK